MNKYNITITNSTKEEWAKMVTELKKNGFSVSEFVRDSTLAKYRRMYSKWVKFKAQKENTC